VDQGARRERGVDWQAMALGGAVGGLGTFLARDVGLFVPLLPASGWMLGAALGGILWGTALRRVVAVATSLLALSWIAVAWLGLAPLARRGLVRRDAEQHADAVLILGSRLQADGEPTSPAFDRLVHALELIRQGWAERLIVPELPSPSAPYAPVARRLMADLGVDAEIVTVGPVHRTRDEALAVGQLCRERGLCRILAVTSPTHSRRASESLEREGLVVFSSPAIETRFDLETLDRPEERLPAFASMLHEHLGLWYYAARGWTGPARR
jgi:uncharacterized SAM-binding protein YcdF (DUF218 family)